MTYFELFHLKKATLQLSKYLLLFFYFQADEVVSNSLYSIHTVFACTKSVNLLNLVFVHLAKYIITVESQDCTTT